MSNWLRIVLAIVVGAHGIGHILFLMPLVSSTNWGQAAHLEQTGHVAGHFCPGF